MGITISQRFLGGDRMLIERFRAFVVNKPGWEKDQRSVSGARSAVLHEIG